MARLFKFLYGFGATVVIASFFYVLGSFDPFAVYLPAWVRLFGGFFFGAGLGLRLWATWVFWTQGLGTPLPPVQPTRLVIAGPYKFSRNPLYLGILLMAAGAALLFGSPLVMALTVLVWVLCEWGIRREEKTLQERYGEVYRLYRSRVRRWL